MAFILHLGGVREAYNHGGRFWQVDLASVYITYLLVQSLRNKIGNNVRTQVQKRSRILLLSVERVGLVMVNGKESGYTSIKSNGATSIVVGDD